MAEKLTDIELNDIQMSESRSRSLVTDGSLYVKEDDIETAMGLLHVCVQGNTHKPAILTYHDIGLNSATCFQGFFSYDDMQPILKHFCLYHVNAPGQHEGAMPLPQGGARRSESAELLDHVGHNVSSVEVNATNTSLKRASLGFTGDAQMIANYQYPTMDNLAEMLMPVLQFYNLRTVIGFGVGAGANVLARFALLHPDKVDALALINCTSEKAGWTEWGYQKYNTWYLKSGTVSASVEDYLLWHWFGERTMSTNFDLNVTYSNYMKTINPQNLAHFIESYVKRGDLGIAREMSILRKSEVKNFACPVMLVAGDFSPHLQDTVNMNARLDPTNSTWMKFECGGMILEEVPNKLCDAFRLFLQGMGYVPSLSRMNLKMSSTSIASTSHCSSKTSMRTSKPTVHGDAGAVLNPAVC